MSLLSIGVRPRFRKSALNPSSEMRIVVGAKLDVPLDSKAFGILAVGDIVFRDVEALIAPRTNRMNNTIANPGSRMKCMARLVFLLPLCFDCMKISEDDLDVELDLDVPSDLPSSIS